MATTLELEAQCWRYVLKRFREIFPDDKLPEAMEDAAFEICLRVELLADENDDLADENFHRTMQDDVEQTAEALAHDERWPNHAITWH